MSFRQVVIRKANKIKLSNNNLVIVDKENKEIHIPLEDIFTILIEDPNTVLTTRIISECSKNKITIVTCDEKHVPVSIIQGFNLHHRSKYVFDKQNALDENVKSLLWKQIIQKKIHNQYLVVTNTSNELDDIEMLKKYSMNVKNSDIDNREGIAAKVFFKSLYGTEFIRFYDDGINNAMNYGYKIIASAITREIVAYGLDPKLGIWHDSQQNSYNLCYDIIEVFRPLVDYCIFENTHLIENELTLLIRRELINLLNIRMEMNGKMQTVQNCIGVIIKSYLNVLEGKKKLLELPNIIKVDFYIHE